MYSTVNFVVTHQVIFINVLSSVKNGQAYYVSPYCIVLSMPVEFLKKTKKKKKRKKLLFHRVRTATWSLILWKRTPPRRSDILLLRSDDNIKHCGWKKFQSRLRLHSHANRLPGETRASDYTGPQFLIMWQDVAINGSPGITSSALESFELFPLFKFKAFF